LWKAVYSTRNVYSFGDVPCPFTLSVDFSSISVGDVLERCLQQLFIFCARAFAGGIAIFFMLDTQTLKIRKKGGFAGDISILAGITYRHICPFQLM